MSTYQWAADLQPLPVAVLLLWAGGWKLGGTQAAAAAARTGLGRLVGESRQFTAYRAVGAAELATALLLVVPVTHVAGAVAATLLSTGFLGYLSWARATAPDSSCGCLSAKQARITWRALTRAALLLLASAVAVTAAGSWSSSDRPVGAAVLVLGEVLLACSLSAELDGYWLLPLRRLRVRISHPLANGGGWDVPLDSTVQQLERSPAFSRVSPVLRSAIQDTWDEGEWRLLSYSAEVGERRLTAVFAVPRLRYAPDDVRVALVDESRADEVGQPAEPVLA